MYLLYPSLQKGKNDLNEMNIFFNENNVMLEIKWDGGTEKFKSVGKYFKICTSIKMITISYFFKKKKMEIRSLLESGLLLA